MTLLIVFVAMFAAACGTARTTIVSAPKAKSVFAAAMFFEGKSPVVVPAEVKAKFVEYLNDYLFKEGPFQKGSDLLIQYRFIQYRPGSQFTRWMIGFLGGRGSITIEAKFMDRNRTPLATIQAYGEISAGFFGGSFNYAVDNAAEEVAKYAVKMFR
jgi:hypothetical protein